MLKATAQLCAFIAARRHANVTQCLLRQAVDPLPNFGRPDQK